MAAGDNIIGIRRSERLTQAEFAHLVGVSKETVCRWEKNRSSLRSSHVAKIMELFNVSADDVLSDSVGFANKARLERTASSQVDDNRRNSDSPSPLAPIPVYRINRSPAGMTLQAVSNAYASPDISQRHPRAVFLQQTGRELDRILPGKSLILVDPDLKPWNGCMVVAMVEQLGIISRRFSAGTTTVMLSTASYQANATDLVVEKRKFKLIGVVVWFQAIRDLSGS